MPIVCHQNIAKTIATQAIWRIEESEAWFLEQLQLNDAECVQLEEIKGWRRMEWLAVRHLVATMLPDHERPVLVKDEYGKPFLHNSSLQVSISHSHHLAAAMLSEQVIGIDIQKIVAKIERLAPRFLSEKELAFIHPGANRLEQLHVCWCAKEALYKAYGKREIDFCDHLFLDPFVYTSEGGTFQGRVLKGEYDERFDLRYSMVEDCILVTGVTPILRANDHPVYANPHVRT